ncbi:MAG: hypothetical protein IKI35_05660 [Stomatobaculum sp.]|nr:hypothetical protein [Stomatobaculum sp.]MBR7058195.1 hypothetical protein [Stomatobaculum sp.]
MSIRKNFNESHSKSCSVCGKKIIVGDLERYVYQREQKTGKLWFCGWTCLRKWEKANPDYGKGRKKNTERKQL